VPAQTARRFRAFAPLALGDYLTELDGDPVTWSVRPVPPTAEGPPSWTVTASDFELTMSVTARVELRGAPPAAAAHRLAAFSADGGELRGVAEAVAVSGVELYFLTVFGHADGEQIVFQFYDTDAQVIHTVRETVSFTANAIVGQPASPQVLAAGSLAYGLSHDILSVQVLDDGFVGSETVRLLVTDATPEALAAEALVTYTVLEALTLPGDVDGDETVTEQDALWILEHVIGERLLTGVEHEAADVNVDGRVSAFDAWRVRQHVLGLDPLPPAP
jgi:hypothetical protein